MSSRLTMILAVALFLGAIAAGYWGLMVSRSAAPAVEQQVVPEVPLEPIVQAKKEKILNGPLAPMVEDMQRVPVMVLARNISAMSEIKIDDLEEELLRIAPPGSFSDAKSLIGKVVWRDLPQGTVLNSASFEVAGPLARMIRPSERALAIDIDEVTSAGGHLQPGDYVDVLLFLREDDTNSDRTVQVVIPALRLLSVGSRLGASTQGEPLSLSDADDANAQRGRRADAARTAVLAVPESLLSRFMLATQVGKLRLAVRSVDEKLLAAYQTGEEPNAEIEELKRQLFQFEKLALKQTKRPQPGLVAPRPTGIPVYSGVSISRQNP